MKLFRLYSPKTLMPKSQKIVSRFQEHGRLFTDNATKGSSSKTTVKGTESDQRLRVRRTRSSDVPHVLRFVREQSRGTWPCLREASLTPASATQVFLADYVSRALAQGHSMMAEQIASRRGWLTVRGLALASAVCPWDAAFLDRWKLCLGDLHSRRLLNFSAHCMRAPSLHDKYRTSNILQVLFIISPECKSKPEVVKMLAKNVIKHGQEAGFPLLRFDISSGYESKVMEDLKLKKEWHFDYDDVLPDKINDTSGSNSGDVTTGGKKHFIAVYTKPLKKKERIEKSAD